MHALVVGGTGPTGHFIVNGLLSRGFEVSVLHRGSHEMIPLTMPLKINYCSAGKS